MFGVAILSTVGNLGLFLIGALIPDAVMWKFATLKNNAAWGIITEAAKAKGIEAIIASVPNGGTIAYFAFRFKYTITEDRYDQILKDIDAR